jgi:hypothetical protein
VIAVDTMDTCQLLVAGHGNPNAYGSALTVSLSSSSIFIFAEGVPEALSPTDTIFDTYPETASTTSIVSVTRV